MPSINKPLKEDEKKKYILHAILFKKNIFSFNDALNWLNFHNYTFIHNRETKNIWRFRIKETIKGYNFYTLDLNNGVELVFLYKP